MVLYLTKRRLTNFEAHCHSSISYTRRKNNKWFFIKFFPSFEQYIVVIIFGKVLISMEKYSAMVCKVVMGCMRINPRPTRWFSLTQNQEVAI